MAVGRWGQRDTVGTTGNSVGRSMGPSLLTTLALAFCSWVVLLAGVASLQQWCAAHNLSETTVGTASDNWRCSQNLSLQWWNMVLEFVVLAAIAASLVSSFWLTSSRVALSTLLGIVTVMLMLDTSTYLSLHRGTTGVTRHRQICYFVGALLCSLFNFLLILILGNHHGAHAAADSGAALGKGAHGTTGTGPAGTTATTGPGIV